MSALLLYKTEPRLYECDAVVVSVKKEAGRTLVVLDKTPFYPEGGGQPSDAGFLDAFMVEAVVESGGDIVHAIQGDIHISSGQKVHLSVDRARRLDHTQQHSGQHLLSANFLRIKNAPTRSFHLGAEYSTIDIDIPALDAADADFVEAEANRMIAENYSYKKYVCTHEEALSLPLRRQPPEGEQEIRIIEIDGFDYTPCCGTHVDTSLEIQLVKIIRYEKYKGMTRVYFVAGLRAYAYLSKVHRDMETLAKAFGSNVGNLGETVFGTKTKLEKSEYDANYWKTMAAQKDADALSASRAPRTAEADKRFLIHITNEDFDYAMRLSKNLASLGFCVCVASVPGLRLALSVPQDSSIDLAAAIKSLLDQKILKGGGGKTFFQLSAETRKEFDELILELERIPLA